MEKEFEFEQEQIERLQREKAELRLDRDAWVEQHHNRTELIDELQAKLAAAEAALTKLQKLAEERSKYRLMVPPSQIIAAIDAAKTEVKT